MFRKGYHLFFILIILTVVSCGHSGDRRPERTVYASGPDERIRHDSMAVTLKRFLQDPCFRNSIIGFTLYDFTKGFPKPLFEHNAALGMTPASAQKIFTTAAALEIFGEPVYKEVTVTNLMSVNRRANKLLQMVGEKKYGRYDFHHGSLAVTEYWKSRGVDTKGLYLCDGSGRSHNNIATPRQLSDVLFRMTTSPVFPVFYNSLPLAGVSGTLHKWLVGTPAAGRLRAKTGSLGGVRSFAGYVRTLSGKKLIFTLIINGYDCRNKILKEKVETLMISMVKL